MQVDPVASAVSISTLAGLGAFMTKMSDLNNLEKQRDGAVESLHGYLRGSGAGRRQPKLRRARSRLYRRRCLHVNICTVVLV